MEDSARIQLFLDRISDHPTIERVRSTFPEISPEPLFQAFNNVLRTENRRLLYHVLSLGEYLEEMCQKRNIQEIDLKTSMVAALYHDFAKVSAYLDLDSNILLQKVLRTEAGHSLSAIRLFLYLGDTELAQALRHNSTDFAIDISMNTISLPQLLLNLADKSDNSGERITIAEKLDIVRKKLVGEVGYDDNAEIIACNYLKEAYDSQGDFLRNGYATINKRKRRVLFLQRFDGKYCPPVGIYKDTSSNLKIVENLSKWGYCSTILHEGNFQSFVTENLVVRGVSRSAIPSIPAMCHGYDVVIVEGSTERVRSLSKILKPAAGLVLLLRTFIDGHLTSRRLQNSLSADAIWTMTDDMQNIIRSQLNDFEERQGIPDVEILQSGIDFDVFFPPATDAQRIPGKITYVGALTELKGVDVLIEAFKNIREEFPYATLHLIGSKEIYGSANAFAEDYVSIPGIIAHGVLDAASIATHLRSAHFSTLLTKKYETFGKSAMQARVCGTRMIVSANGALPSHVRTPEEGIVLDSIDIETVERALRTMLSTEPHTVLPEEGRYHPWIVTALNFDSYVQMLERKIFQRTLASSD